jgi:inner membrane protein
VDNITHTLSGVVLSRAGLNRLSPNATLLLVVAVNAADLDVLTALAGPVASLRYHRGPLHSLVAMPLVALLVTAVVGFLRRRNFRWGDAYVVSLVGAASNPIFDLANNYGVRILWPFSNRWIHADFLPIVDPWIWMLLLLGLVAPWLSRLVSSEIGAKAGSGRGAAVLVLCLLGAYGFGRHLLHERAVAVLDSRMYQGEVPVRVAAIPSLANPFRWTGLVEGKQFIERHPELDLLEEFNPSAGVIYYKPEPGPEIDRARQTVLFRAFLDFAQWPLWRVTPLTGPEGGVTVELTDLRFGAPGDSRFAVTARVDASGRVVDTSARF